MPYEFGDVGLVRFPFTNQAAFEKRPASIVSSRAYNVAKTDVIIVAITSQVHSPSSLGKVVNTRKPEDLLAFYRGLAADNRGRYLQEILLWDDVDLENVHDYIQWLFPTFERSVFQPDVPVLTKEISVVFRVDPELQDRLRTSFGRLLQFYGFRIDLSSAIRIVAAQNFPERAEVWVTRGNHNHLRITRILKSLTALGLREEAHAFLSCLEDLWEQSPTMREAVPHLTLNFWRSGVSAG
jgi:hypothetical protein